MISNIDWGWNRKTKMEHYAPLSSKNISRSLCSTKTENLIFATIWSWLALAVASRPIGMNMAMCALLPLLILCEIAKICSFIWLMTLFKSLDRTTENMRMEIRFPMSNCRSISVRSARNNYGKSRWVLLSRSYQKWKK